MHKYHNSKKLRVAYLNTWNIYERSEEDEVIFSSIILISLFLHEMAIDFQILRKIFLPIGWTFKEIEEFLLAVNSLYLLWNSDLSIVWALCRTVFLSCPYLIFPSFFSLFANFELHLPSSLLFSTGICRKNPVCFLRRTQVAAISWCLSLRSQLSVSTPIFVLSDVFIPLFFVFLFNIALFCHCWL